jgi:hypothetical protein
VHPARLSQPRRDVTSVAGGDLSRRAVDALGNGTLSPRSPSSCEPGEGCPSTDGRGVGTGPGASPPAIYVAPLRGAPDGRAAPKGFEIKFNLW